MDEELIVNLKSVTYEEGVKASNKLFDLNPIPDGIFASGDIIAVSAVQTAKKRGIKVPDDVAIIGFNNDPISQIIDPNLSTITHPAEKMGKAASEIIIKNLKSLKRDEVKEITFLNTEVLIRESSDRNKL
ncbi:MAG: substrate-binding domain-containing protein [Flavobacterium sp.]